MFSLFFIILSQGAGGGTFFERFLSVGLLECHYKDVGDIWAPIYRYMFHW